MSGLCGWFSSDRSASTDPEVIAAIALTMNRFDDQTVSTSSAGFGFVAGSAPTGEIDIYRTEGELVAVWGSIRFIDEELAAVAQHGGPARALAQGYERKSVDVFTLISGSFALAILHRRTGTAVLAVDRMGTRPMSYSTAGARLLFGSALDAISALAGVSPVIENQAIYDYVHFHVVPGPRTVHVGRQRLLPGTFMRWHNGRIQTQPYWEMEFVENRRQSFPALKETFLALLRNSVRDAARRDNVGAFLSGGTDSSTLAGMLRDVTGQSARTYSIGFEAEGYDEMEYARIAARHFETRHHEYYVTPDDVVAAIPQIAAIHDQPFGNSSAVPTFYCAKLARADGICTLLGGDGGDELFGGNDRYAKQYIYSLYGDLPVALRKRFIEPIAFMLPEAGLFGKAQRYITNASQPMPARYDDYNLLERLGASRVFTEDFLATVDTRQPQAIVAQAYEDAHASSLINRMLALDLRLTLADNDLPKVTRSCELAQVSVRFPMLDDAVVAFSAGLVPALKLKGTKLRYFFKEALRGYLPDAIIAKKKHGFGLPFGLWLTSHPPLQQIAMDSLSDLKKRQIVRPQFIDELTSRHVLSHAAYYGTMVWVLMMLEQWFRQHRTGSLHPPLHGAPHASADVV